MDVGAAIKFVWSNPEKYSNIVIHLGDFHFMKENIKVVYSLIKSFTIETVLTIAFCQKV